MFAHDNSVYTSPLRRFNNGLTIVIVLLGIYIIILPFLPYFKLWINDILDGTNGVRYSGQLAEQSGVTNGLSKPPDDNRLVIPQIQIDNEIIVGEDPSNVDRGVWHRPQTSTPDMGGNTVLVGHRFSYSDPATFYHLDKMKVDDTFAVWWQGKEYIYKVFNIAIVGPKAVEIEANTDEPLLTLYTCTPIWTAENRLVIQSKLMNPEVLNVSEEL